MYFVSINRYCHQIFIACWPEKPYTDVPFEIDQRAPIKEMAKISVALLLFTLQVLLLSECSVAFITVRTVNITSDLGEFIPLTIHCRSEDNDLGVHELQFHSSFHWEFKSDPAIPTTDFYCFMSWQGVNSGTFDVYRAKRDDERCKVCWWNIRQTGAYSLSERDHRWDLMYIWGK